MGLIKEPKGIDFIIKSQRLTKKEKAAIIEYIKQYKLKQSKKKKTAQALIKGEKSGFVKNFDAKTNLKKLHSKHL
ncbi:MAG: hypothetical protein FJY20_06310 [Bacteroidetes bacterium]|nr:hypothetical protein [Bacteroidota bacterium]